MAVSLEAFKDAAVGTAMQRARKKAGANTGPS